MADNYDWSKLLEPLTILAGAYVGSQSGAKQSGTTTTTVQPYAGAIPHINAALDQAGTIYKQQANMPDWLQGLYNQGIGVNKAVMAQQMPTMSNLGIGSGLDWNGIQKSIDYKPQTNWYGLLNGGK